jgi:hypothetical protein
MYIYIFVYTISYAMEGPGRKSVFTAGLRPDFIGRALKSLSDRPKAVRRAVFEALPIRIRLKPGPETQFPARNHFCLT